MSVNGDTSTRIGFDATDHQTAYVYTPATSFDHAPDRSAKRSKLGNQRTSALAVQERTKAHKFKPLLNGLESPECVSLRQGLFESCWSYADARIQSILSEANDDTLAVVTSFVHKARPAEDTARVPASFIVTGPNIASQGLLFGQLSDRLKQEINGPVVTLRSGDASNLKTTLKKLIRDATNQRSNMEDFEGTSFEQDGRKLLNYDLELLYGYVKIHGCQRVVVALQDSEAFDTGLLADLIALFSSWLDRIPFILLFGIATSVELFQQRLSMAATLCLYGVQVDVEQTSSILERVLQKVVVGSDSPLRIGPGLVSSLLERQHDHVQSFQAFAGAIKYAYMCHFYANPLSVLCEVGRSSKPVLNHIQTEHFEAVRMLPSFRNLIEDLLEQRQLTRVRGLLEDDNQLSKEIATSLKSRDKIVTKLLRAMHVLLSITNGTLGKVDLYLMAFTGSLNGSHIVRDLLDSIRRMTPGKLMTFAQALIKAVEKGCPDFDLDGWSAEASEFLAEIGQIQRKTALIAETCVGTGRSVRSAYAIHGKGVRTTVVAQKVQLSQVTSTLSKEDKDFTALIDHFSQTLETFLTFENPQRIFLNEAWLYDSKSPCRDVFTPRPRFAIERALSVPHDYLGCRCCKTAVEGLSSSQPPTAILYQLYLETGSLINVFDLWSAFFTIIGGVDDDDCNERDALVLFYRALADLKLLGVIKQSKKKADHLAKLTWKGL